MIKYFGDIGILAYKILEVIIKLIPKLALKQNIIDWRLIMLLNIIYKIIGFFLAIRLVLFLPDLINEQ